MKAFIFALGLLVFGYANAGGYSATAIPTKVDIIQGQGFMIFGAFGNPAGCTLGNSLLVRSDHSQYKQMYAAALAAMMSGKKISAYAHACEPVGWFTVMTTTYNTVLPGGTLAISD